ncbi:MAG: hypothetical protein AABW80_01480 [Nanoarchaeota archaeon]
MEEETDLHKIHSLIADINTLNLSYFGREVILLLAIYAEYISLKLFNINYGYSKNKKFKEHMNRLKYLEEQSLISDTEFKTLKALNDVRDELAHKLDLDENYLIGVMNKAIINWEEGFSEEIKKIKDELDSKPYSKFSMACITKILYLFTKISKSEDFKVIFKIHKNDNFQIETKDFPLHKNGS